MEIIIANIYWALIGTSLTFFISLNPHRYPMKKVNLSALSLCYRWEQVRERDGL